MRKTVTYPSFLVVGFLVAMIFVTAQNYTQLGVAVALYMLLAYFALKIFPRKAWKTPTIAIQSETKSARKAESVEITDIDKRAFLKLIGAAGISFFLFSLIGRRMPGFLGGAQGVGNGTTTIQDGDGKTISPAERQPTDGYKISEIDDDVITYYGFINKDGAWLIMKEDTDGSSFRYAKGDGGFPSNWTRRENLKYDYFYNVF